MGLEKLPHHNYRIRAGRNKNLSSLAFYRQEKSLIKSEGLQPNIHMLLLGEIK